MHEKILVSLLWGREEFVLKTVDSWVRVEDLIGFHNLFISVDSFSVHKWI